PIPGCPAPERRHHGEGAPRGHRATPRRHRSAQRIALACACGVHAKEVSRPHERPRRHLSGLLRSAHERAPRHRGAVSAAVRPRRRGRRTQPREEDGLHRRRAHRSQARGVREASERAGAGVRRSAGRLCQIGRGDVHHPRDPRAVGLRVRVRDGQHEPPSRPGNRDGLPDDRPGVPLPFGLARQRARRLRRAGRRVRSTERRQAPAGADGKAGSAYWRDRGERLVATLLAADVGNTNVVLGAYDGEKLVATWRTATRADQTEDELAVTLDALLEREELSLDDVDALVLGSVVPPLTASFTRRAARLFRVPLTPPPAAIGKNTADCLRSGIVFGYVGLVEGLLARLVGELRPTTPRIVATGGLAATIAPLAKGIERVDDDLTLEGLRMLWELNA